MAFTSKAGNKFTNHEGMKRDDAKSGGMAKSVAVSEPEPDGDEGMDGGGGGKAMAQQHGPAHMIDIQHDHEGGRHSVHAMHPDGHEHEQEFGSAAEAHQHAGDCAGMGGQ